MKQKGKRIEREQICNTISQSKEAGRPTPDPIPASQCCNDIPFWRIGFDPIESRTGPVHDAGKAIEFTSEIFAKYKILINLMSGFGNTLLAIYKK